MNTRERLQRAGYKLTPARLAIVQVLEDEGAHLSPAEVLERGRAVYPALSRATVYRTLDLLTDMGLLRPIYLGVRGTRVARIAEGHSHLVCLDCGRVVHVSEAASSELGQALWGQLAAQAGHYEVRSYLLELYGVCAECSEPTPAAGNVTA